MIKPIRLRVMINFDLTELQELKRAAKRDHRPLSQFLRVLALRHLVAEPVSEPPPDRAAGRPRRRRGELQGETA
jgi:hypothetical protein